MFRNAVRAAWGLALLLALLLGSRDVGAAPRDDIAAAATTSAPSQVPEPAAAAEGVAAVEGLHVVPNLYMYLCAVVTGRSCASSKAVLEVGLERDVRALAARSGIRLRRDPHVVATRLYSKVADTCPFTVRIYTYGLTNAVLARLAAALTSATPCAPRTPLTSTCARLSYHSHNRWKLGSTVGAMRAFTAATCPAPATQVSGCKASSLPGITQGRWTCRAQPNAEGYLPKDTVCSSTCNDGYTVGGVPGAPAATATCTASGAWTPTTAVTCAVVGCAQVALPKVTKGQWSCAGNLVDGKRLPNTVCTSACDDGHAIGGSATNPPTTTTCTVTNEAKWSPSSDVTCELVQQTDGSCRRDAVPKVLNGHWECPELEEGAQSLPESSMCYVMCDSDYAIDVPVGRDDTTTCQQGAWSPASQIDCEPLRDLERRRLLEAKAAMGSDNACFSTWDPNTNPCAAPGWDHITCDDQSGELRVNKVDLSSCGLAGSLPNTWNQPGLESLRITALGNNALKGYLPGSWWLLTNLREVYLNNNQLTGPLPSEWQEWVYVEKLSLADNNVDGGLVGQVPCQWTAMTSLQALSLTNTGVRGCWPDDFLKSVGTSNLITGVRGDGTCTESACEN